MAEESVTQPTPTGSMQKAAEDGADGLDVLITENDKNERNLAVPVDSEVAATSPPPSRGAFSTSQRATELSADRLSKTRAVRVRRVTRTRIKKPAATIDPAAMRLEQNPSASHSRFREGSHSRFGADLRK